MLNEIISCRNGPVESVFLNKDRAEKLYLKLQQNDILMILESDENYPKQLKDSLGNKCPPLLFVKGNPNLLSSTSVGFCGSRKASEK